MCFTIFTHQKFKMITFILKSLLWYFKTYFGWSLIIKLPMHICGKTQKAVSMSNNDQAYDKMPIKENILLVWNRTRTYHTLRTLRNHCKPSIGICSFKNVVIPVENLHFIWTLNYKRMHHQVHFTRYYFTGSHL